MSKRTPRSKKGDSSVPNFVFTLGGDASGTPPSFNFSGSNTPASPSATGFKFNNSNSSATANFNFGNSPATSQSPFNFNVKRQQSDINTLPNKKDSTGLRRSASEVNLGTTTTPTSNTFQFGSSTSNTGPFVFTPPTSTASQIQFGSPAATSTTSSAFNFAAPTTPTTTSGFTFTPPTATKPSTASAFSFTPPSASTAKSSTTTSAFSFTPPVATSTAKTSSTTAFGFTPPAASTTNTTKPEAKASTPQFTFGTSPSTSSATTAPSFTFGTKPADSKPTEKPAFGFGSPSTTSSAGGFTFKPVEAPKTSTVTKPGSKTTDDIKTSASAPSFTFGATTKPASSTSASFTFGATTSSTTTTPQFTFGSEKKDDKPATSNVTSAPFTFGATASTNTTTTPVATAAPPKPNAFSFIKVLEDLEKAAVQAPSQIHATLMPYVQHQTSFRIDNIQKSTRFTELPEQAQKELDELEKYIRLENQRCEYIANHKMHNRSEVTKQTQRHLESLTQQLDAVENMLEGQKRSIETLYDTVKQQLRHANDGSVVLEACKHPGNNPRWLFGYTEEDDYFLQLSKQLGTRFNEYKKCIWEIERTAEAWTQNKVQSPQDIANIIRAQNITFLALSNKVALLHENINSEKNNYNRYLRMYN